VRFYYIYKALSHPELKGYINPFTLEERFMHVKEARRTLGSEIPWIVDRMDNAIRHALGSRSLFPGCFCMISESPGRKKNEADL